MKSEKIIQLAEENNGTVTAAHISKAGIARGSLKDLVERGKLEKVARGVYILPDHLEDEFVNYQSQFKKGIYSDETALFLHDLTDRTPLSFSMTFPDGYNLSKVKEAGIDASRSREPYYSMGIDSLASPSGNDVRAYDMEKTLCDILRPRSGADIQVISEAYKRYVKRKDKNIPKLSEYAKKLKVEEKVRSYLEVLL
jgi:predicted transcriptional regulator of viral defense system